MTQTKTLTLRSADVPQVFKFGIGFEDLFEELRRTHHQHNDNYPPCNVIRQSDSEFTIELAVAGFGRDELEIEVAGQTLSITGNRVPRAAVEYVTQGIAYRNFTKTFTLAEHVEVVGAANVNGILTIHLERRVPENKKPKTIDISYDN